MALNVRSCRYFLCTTMYITINSFFRWPLSPYGSKQRRREWLPCDYCHYQRWWWPADTISTSHSSTHATTSYNAISSSSTTAPPTATSQTPCSQSRPCRCSRNGKWWSKARRKEALYIDLHEQRWHGLHLRTQLCQSGLDHHQRCICWGTPDMLEPWAHVRSSAENSAPAVVWAGQTAARAVCSASAWTTRSYKPDPPGTAATSASATITTASWAICWRSSCSSSGRWSGEAANQIRRSILYIFLTKLSFLARRKYSLFFFTQLRLSCSL